ncbi:metal ABC transporter permease [Anoxybacillus flavithermus]|uniref:metal ABC transporter permease n=1 Tax=Anoxybacillus flavithermus TaxID=33934 RepID=UPI003CC71702
MALLGLASGMIGTFALLKKQSLIGDAMAHAALPGICIAFLFYGQKSLLVFFNWCCLFRLYGNSMYSVYCKTYAH